jgi:hypothetical protein
MKTLKAFIQTTNLSAHLVRAVVRQVGGWESFKESASDIANHGADAGWVGFTYYSDTIKFTKRHKQELLCMANVQAQELGESSGFTLIAGFQCLKSYSADEVFDALINPRSDARTAVFNALAWYALEEVARSYVDCVEAQ